LRPGDRPAQALPTRRGLAMTARARRGWTSGLRTLPRRLLMLPVRGYQVGISPYTPPACRYDPVCSQYGMDALAVHGAVNGVLLTPRLILRCNPVTRGGLAPLPAPGVWGNPRRLRRSGP